MVISKEYHLGDEPEIDREHFHAYIWVVKKFDIKNSRFFDIDGRHPFITRPLDRERVITYIKKDGEYLEDG
jgi:hypothetical protein